MSAVSQHAAGTGLDASNGRAERSWDGIPARIFLQPIAAPSILGLFGFAAATFIVASNLAGWYGTKESPLFLFPFAAAFGGIGQFAAGMWAYRARDAVATAMHGTWGSFWIAYGIFWWLTANHTLTPPATTKFPELGFWFVVLGAITTMGALASLAESGSLFMVLGTLAAGSILLAIAYLAGNATVEKAGGWVLVASAIAAWYTASAMMLAGATGRTVLPLFKWSRAANAPGGRPTVAVQYEAGEPGIKQGQ
jgi:succinate-acetate transporter protein